MTTASPDNPRPNEPLLVIPAYMAGPGDPTTVHDALAAAPGWGKAVTSNGILYVSPRMDTHAAWLPETRYGGWKFTYYEGPLSVAVWSAGFTETAPAEIVTAFARSLVDDGPRPLHEKAADPNRVLRDESWYPYTLHNGRYHDSVDGNAYFCQRTFDVDDHAELSGANRPLWMMYACADDSYGRPWHADFSTRTPLHLVNAAVHAFATTDPVRRLRSEIPEQSLPHVTTAPAPEHSPDEPPDRRQSAALTRATAPPPPATGPAGTPPRTPSAPPAPHRHR
jgi:hypothetical protein